MDLLTVQEAARELRVSPITIRRYIKSGRLRCIRLGRTIRLRRDDIQSIGSVDDVEAFWRSVEPTSEDDALWQIIGAAPADGPTDVAANKRKYLVKDYETRIQKDTEQSRSHSGA